MFTRKALKARSQQRAGSHGGESAEYLDGYYGEPRPNAAPLSKATQDWLRGAADAEVED